MIEYLARSEIFFGRINYSLKRQYVIPGAYFTTNIFHQTDGNHSPSSTGKIVAPAVVTIKQGNLVIYVTGPWTESCELEMHVLTF